MEVLGGTFKELYFFIGSVVNIVLFIKINCNKYIVKKIFSHTFFLSGLVMTQTTSFGIPETNKKGDESSQTQYIE